jgi:SAM-dependent methyltransferase
MTHKSPTMLSDSSSDPSSDSSSDAQIGVAAMYDAVAAESRAPDAKRRRRTGPLIRTVSFDNWIKRVLIDKAVAPGAAVLDLGGGKGGDLAKVAHAGARVYVCCDLSRECCAEGQRRARTWAHSIDARFHQLNMTEPGAVRRATGKLQFEAALCMFAIHYGAGSDAALRATLDNATAQLRGNGLFVGTTVDPAVLFGDAVAEAVASHGVFSVDYQGTTLCRIAVDNVSVYCAAAEQYRQRKPIDPPFRYRFTLKDHVRDTPEYAVCPVTLRRLAAEAGLDVLLWRNNADLYRSVAAKPGPLPFPQVWDGDWAALNASDRQIVGLYGSFILRKRP